MPEISRFNGIVISMLFKDIKQHNKPHIHVSYAEYEATVSKVNYVRIKWHSIR